MIKALIPLAEGCEEMEAVVMIDVFRRAGWDVTAAGFAEGPVTCSRKVRIVPDARWDDIDPLAFDVLALPGGARGAAALRKDARVIRAIRIFAERGKVVAAICAGPLVLADAGVLMGRRATCHPDVANELTDARWEDQPVVIDGNVITSQGAGTTQAFALAVVEQVAGPQKAREVEKGMAIGGEHPH